MYTCTSRDPKDNVLAMCSALTAIMIENLESESENMEIQVATLDMSREDSPVSGKISRPSIIDLAEAVYKPGKKHPPSDKFNLKQDLLSYTFSKYIIIIH